MFVCPETRIPLTEVDLEYAELLISGGSPLSARLNQVPSPVGITARVMLRSDHACGYPVADGIPVLLGPEMLVPAERARPINLHDPRYDEAYREMAHYNTIGFESAEQVETSSSAKHLEPVQRLDKQARMAFPEPSSVWINSAFDGAAEWDAYQHIGSLEGKRVLQIGGVGLHAVKFLMAGCEQACLVAPMLGELTSARRLAVMMGVDSNLHCAAGVGEAIPLPDDSVDVVITVGCVHHMQTEMAIPEIARVLATNGTFVAVEPWRAPLYGIGTRILGKRQAKLFSRGDVGVYCRPMTPERAEPLYTSFRHAQIVHHGTLTRYFLLALWKCGLGLPPTVVRNIISIDDRFCSLFPGLRRYGSIVALLATR